MYPSIIGEYNIAANTQIGRIEIPSKVYNHENTYKLENYSRSGEFVENMVCDNIIEYCHRWFHLGGIKECIEDIDEYCNNLGVMKYSSLVGLGISGIEELKHIDKSRKIISPIRFTNNDNYKKPIIFYDKKDPNITYEKILLNNQ